MQSHNNSNGLFVIWKNNLKKNLPGRICMED